MLPATLPRIPYEHRRVTTGDGVTLSVQVAGEGPPVLLANGIAVVSPGLDVLAEHLLPRHRIIAWDYRGIRGSRIDDPGADYSIGRHGLDALEILEALDVPRAAVLGWSMGVPVGLELLRRAPERVAAYGALFGSPGTPFRLAFSRRVSELVHRGVHWSRRSPWLVQAVLDLGVAVPPLAWAVCTGVRFTGSHSHRAVFHRDVQSHRDADKRAYFGTMTQLIDHEAWDVLPGVRCPCLVVAGDQDWVTPPEPAERMARLLPEAEFVMIRGATHFGIIEHGPELWDPIDRLLARARY
jgi:pimeloyl-ACP methyl ester carboxylesterase